MTVHSGDKWIERIATKILGLNSEEAVDITRFVLDGRRGERMRLRIYWNNLGKEEAFDILPVVEGGYELVEVENV